MAPVITVDNLGKCYRVSHGEQRCGYQTLRESLTNCITGVVRRWRTGMSTQRSEDFWALRDVSFAVQPGEAVGIIGRNGAGKSTLLKILSRITKPTRGQVRIRGRVGSLLEVGTGFHPELTGHENIYLNGSILGMSRREITRHFDEIVNFAEVERFLDTPVKRYSSGMYVRLAFAVAAHLEPEILLVDEVLAVGDAEFQKKCLGKMSQVAGDGRTVFFVSHQMSAVQRLCDKAILLAGGRVAACGPKEEVINRYLSEGPQALAPDRWIDLTSADRSGGQEAHFVAARYTSPNAATADRPYPDGPLEVRVALESDAPRAVPSLGVTLSDRYGTKLVNADTLARGRTVQLRKGRNEFRVLIDHLHLNPGVYTVSLWLAQSPHVFDHLPTAFEIEVVDAAEGFGQRPRCDGAVTCPFDVFASGAAMEPLPGSPVPRQTTG